MLYIVNSQFIFLSVRSYMRLNYAWQAERLLLLSFSQPVTGATNHVDLPIIPLTTLHP